MGEVTLECQNLVKTFGGVRSVDDLSLSFEDGRVTALIGPNGAGKTTLFHLMTGFLTPDSGEIWYRGRRIDHLPAWRVARAGIGRLFQDVRVFGKLTAEENVRAAFVDQRGENALWAFLRHSEVQRQEGQNSDIARQLLDEVGLVEYLDTPAEALSYGQQKLLAIARLLAMRSDVLLLDEPTAGVHPDIVERLLDLVRRLAQEGRTVVVIEHNMDVVLAVADWVNFLNEGQIVAFGSAADVLGEEEIRAAYLGL